MKRHTVTFIFLLLALALYAVGAAVPATALLVLGGVAELMFWSRLFSSKKGGHDT
jgi:hypothetical protein